MSEVLRMCCICRKMMPKNTLLRVVKNKEGHIFIDESGKANGRGAYICKNMECAMKLKKTRALNRAFKSQVKDEIYEELLKGRFDGRKEEN